ncbi:kinase-like domain-containing protein [Obelidium mucronatum]|nr:kinase-like domain-containing protein [Obelidium mucronatum]
MLPHELQQLLPAGNAKTHESGTEGAAASGEYSAGTPGRVIPPLANYNRQEKPYSERIRAHRGFVDLEQALGPSDFSRITMSPGRSSSGDTGTLVLNRDNFDRVPDESPMSNFSLGTPTTPKNQVPMMAGVAILPSPGSQQNRQSSTVNSNTCLSPTASAKPPLPKQTSKPAMEAKADEQDHPQQDDLSEFAKPNPANLHLLFLPLAKNYLGQGRYSRVYLSNYTLTSPSSLPSNDNTKPPTTKTASTATPLDKISLQTDQDAFPCAVKQMHATRECFDGALMEAKVLRLLKGHPNIVQLIGTTSEEENSSTTITAAAAGSRNQMRRRRRRASFIRGGGGVRRMRSSLGQGVVADSDGEEASNNGGWSDDDDVGYSEDDDDEDAEDGIPRILLVMELAIHGTMMDYINRVQGSGGVGQDIWMRWAKQLASAVDYVHSFGFIHHDIKPHNCLLTESIDIKLADFGNALQVNGFQPIHQRSAESPPLTPNELNPRDTSTTSYLLPPSSLPMPSSTSSATTSAEHSRNPSSTTSNYYPHLTQSPNTSPQARAIPFPISRENSSVQSESLYLPNNNSSVPNTSSCLSPRSFVDRFKSELSDAASVRSSRTGSLTDGLGRGTQAYMAPEMFTLPTGSAAEYSFAVDVYAVGVTLFVAVTGVQPFNGAQGSVYMMMGIRRGFWASGLQTGFGVYGPEVSSMPKGGETVDQAVAGTFARNGAEMRKSLCQGGGSSSAGVSGIKANRWLQEGDCVAGGEGVLRFGGSGGGSRLDPEAVRIMCACLEMDGGVRPTARELVVWLNTLGI